MITPLMIDMPINITAKAQSSDTHPYLEGYEYLWDVTAIYATYNEGVIGVIDPKWEVKYTQVYSLYGKPFGSKVFYALYDKRREKFYRVNRGVYYVYEKFPSRGYYICDSKVLIQKGNSYAPSIALFFNIED